MSFNCVKNKYPISPEVENMYMIYISDFIPDWNNPVVPSVNDLNLIREPFLSANDIKVYKWSRHQIVFSESVHERLKSWGNLLHRIFVVVADGEKIYWGKFMDDLDSGSCQNPVIRLLFRHPNAGNGSTTPETLIIDRAYPGYSGAKSDHDIRNDERIYNVLKKSGILFL